MTKITQLTLALFLMFGISNVFAFENTNSDNGQSSQTGTIQRVRLDVMTSMGFTRHLLLGFTTDNIATDGFDYGYDGKNIDNFPDDCNWIINGDRFVIQGVGAFDETKKYPLGLFLSNSGTINMSLNSLENFDSPIDVFIYDALNDTYTKINNAAFSSNILSGDYLDRFFIAFQDENALPENASLSIEETDIKTTIVNYLSNTKELYINTNSSQKIKNIRIYNILGKELFYKNNINTKEIKIPMQYINTNYGIVSVETDKGTLSKKFVLK